MPHVQHLFVFPRSTNHIIAFCHCRCCLRCLNSIQTPINCRPIDLISVRIINLDNAVTVLTDGPRPNERQRDIWFIWTSAYKFVRIPPVWSWAINFWRQVLENFIFQIKFLNNAYCSWRWCKIKRNWQKFKTSWKVLVNEKSWEKHKAERKRKIVTAVEMIKSREKERPKIFKKNSSVERSRCDRTPYFMHIIIQNWNYLEH